MVLIIYVCKSSTELLDFNEMKRMGEKMLKSI